MPRKPAGRSIEDRPEHINDRSTFGHWEMDSVESCQGVSNTYIVMTERKTRREIIIPSPDKTSASVVAALDTLEKKVGSKVFPCIRTLSVRTGLYRRRDRTQRHRPGIPHRGLLLPPVPPERTRIQREPERPHTSAPAEGHRPEHDLLRGDQADRGLAEQLPPQNVRLSVLRAAFPGRNRPHSGLIKNIFAFLCIYS